MYVWCVATWFLFCIFQDPPESGVYFSPSGVQFTEASVEQGLLPLKSLKVAAFGSVFLIVNPCLHCFHQHFLSSIACSLHCPMVVFIINPIQFISTTWPSLSWILRQTDRGAATRALTWVRMPEHCSELQVFLLGSSGGFFNSLDFCPAVLKSLGCFYFWCVLSSQWKAVTVNLQILHCLL